MDQNKVALFATSVTLSSLSMLFLLVSALSSGDDDDRVEKLAWYTFEQKLENDNGQGLTVDYYWAIDAYKQVLSGKLAKNFDKSNVIDYFDCATGEHENSSDVNFLGRVPCGACWAVSRGTLGFLLFALIAAALSFVVAFLRFFESYSDKMLKGPAIIIPLLGSLCGFMSAGLSIDGCAQMINESLKNFGDVEGNDYSDDSDRQTVTMQFPPISIIFSAIMLFTICLVTVFVPGHEKQGPMSSA